MKTNQSILAACLLGGMLQFANAQSIGLNLGAGRADAAFELDDEINATGDSTSYTDSGIAFSTSPKRFYRVRLASETP